MPEKVNNKPALPQTTASTPAFPDRKMQILQAAARMIAEKGYHGATTKEIAEAAQVSEGSLYNYFENKEDLILNILALVTENEIRLSQAELALNDESREFFTDYLNNHKIFWDEYAEMLQAIMSEILSNSQLRKRYQQDLITPSLTGLETLLSQQQQRGYIQDIDVTLISRLLLAVLLGLYQLHAIGDEQTNKEWDRLAQLTTGVLFQGLTHLDISNDGFDG